VNVEVTEDESVPEEGPTFMEVERIKMSKRGVN
jgi:hypothetical protein